MILSVLLQSRKQSRIALDCFLLHLSQVKSALGRGGMVGRVQFRRCRITAMLFKKFAGALDIVCEQLGNIPIHVWTHHDPEAGDFLGHRAA